MGSDITGSAAASGNFAQFMGSLREPDSPDPIISARRFAAALHIDMQTLARLAHVHRNTIGRLSGVSVEPIPY